MIELSAAEKKIFKDAKEFSLEMIYPRADFWENNPGHSNEAIKIMADAGYCGLNIPEKLGGKGYSFLETALAYEGLAHGSGIIAFLIQLHNNILFEIVSYYNENSYINSIISELVIGKKTIAFALTEEHSGSDPASMKSYAELKDDGYHINGKKAWIFNSLEADYFNVIVKENSSESDKMIMLLVEQDNPGLKIGENRLRIGSNTVSCCDLEFNNCIVSKKSLFSHNAYKETLKAIDIARTFVPAIAIGMAQRVIDLTVDYLGERKSFNKAIIKNQGIQWELADLLAKVEAGRWLVYRTASMMNSGKKLSKQTAMTKLYCTDVAMKTTIKCLQFFGAEGYAKNSALARYMTVAKLFQIIDGTSEIQKLVIGRSFLK